MREIITSGVNKSAGYGVVINLKPEAGAINERRETRKREFHRSKDGKCLRNNTYQLLIVFYRGFKIGMKCLDDYSNLCLTLDEKNMITENINGATSTFKFLCDDEVFQKGKYTSISILVDIRFSSVNINSYIRFHSENKTNFDYLLPILI